MIAFQTTAGSPHDWRLPAVVSEDWGLPTTCLEEGDGGDTAAHSGHGTRMFSPI